MKKVVRIGTRKSALALAQAATVAAEIELRRPDWKCELVKIVTSGDMKQSAPESTPRDKRDWVAEIEHCLISGEVDLAVHSGKDVPVEIHQQTLVRSVLERATVNDVFFLKDCSASLLEKKSAFGEFDFFKLLPYGATVGTASLRRKAQLLNKRPDLKVLPLRGNVPTRLDKLAESSELSAIVLAGAGVSRLSGVRAPDGVFSVLDMLPAVAQGTLCAQYRSPVLDSQNLRIGSNDIYQIISEISALETELMWTAERAVVRTLGAGCHSAVGSLAEVNGDSLTVRAKVYSVDGSSFIEAHALGPKQNAVSLGQEVGNSLIKLGAASLLNS